MKPNGTLILKRSEVATLLSLEECIGAVEQAFRMNEEGRSLPPGVLETLTMDGGFHIKAAGLTLDATPYYAAKVNANFPRNMGQRGLPAIQGIIALFDSESGYPLALLDSMEITILRTGAKYLARPDSRVATICGCGVQGRVQLKALMQVLRLEKVYVYDQDEVQSGRFADEMSRELKAEVMSVTNLPRAIQESDVCVTCTPSRRPFLMRQHVRPGTFVAAVGTDNPLKQEVEPALLAVNKVVVDVLEQCATIGDLHHAIADGVMSKSDVYAELGTIVAGRAPGRTSAEEIIIFDSTGTALQDVAAASVVYEKALGGGLGVCLNLAE
ncbi:MAG: ornithine cyclodeaminase family protein [Pyrinomonadaceae bacterium]